MYRLLRDEEPVYHDAERSFWALSRYADVRAALRDHVTFSSAQGIGRPGDLMDLDPPAHGHLRALIAPRFSRGPVAALEAPIGEIAAQLALGLAGRRDGDLVAAVARPLPALVIGRALGIDDADAAAFAAVALALLPRRAEDRAPIEARAAIVDLLLARVRASIGAGPGDDLLGDLARAATAGALERPALAGLCLMLVIAGIEPTASLLGAILRALAGGEVAETEIRGSDGRVRAAAIDEFLRHDPPVQWVSRVTTRTVTISGRRLPAGARVLLLLGSANRDPRRFRAPDELDLGRADASGLALGAGIHACLGAGLARLEARAGLEALLDRVGAFTLAAAPLRSPSHVIRGYASLPVQIAAGTGARG